MYSLQLEQNELVEIEMAHRKQTFLFQLIRCIASLVFLLVPYMYTRASFTLSSNLIFFNYSLYARCMYGILQMGKR